MRTKRQRQIDILSAGELLIDMISKDFAENMEDAEQFVRLQGGSPANLCMNMSRLGNAAELVASLGQDDMGQFLFECVERAGVSTRSLRRVAAPTTLILVTRSQEVSDFQAYRGADAEIQAEQFATIDFSEVSIFHTTCFGISRVPAQQHILSAAEAAAKAGCQLSIDINYAEKIWPNREQAQQLVAQYCRWGALIKVSDVDWGRLYDQPLDSGQRAIDYFLERGATAVCLTLGAEGCRVGSTQGSAFLPTRPVDIKDTTGTGDAFWSGFLTAWLDGYGLEDCALAGRRMAEIKLGHFGPLPGKVDRARIYEDIIKA